MINICYKHMSRSYYVLSLAYIMTISDVTVDGLKLSHCRSKVYFLAYYVQQRWAITIRLINKQL